MEEIKNEVVEGTVEVVEEVAVEPTYLETMAGEVAPVEVKEEVKAEDVPSDPAESEDVCIACQ